MKYKFNFEDDIVSLKYKDKEFTFKTNVKLISEMQGLVMDARIKMIQDISKEGQSIKDLTKEIKKDGKTYYDNSNKLELEKIYQEKVTLEYFNKKCEEYFKMDLPSLIQDIGLEGEDEGATFTSDLMAYMTGNIPR